MIDLPTYGWNHFFHQAKEKSPHKNKKHARVISVHKSQYEIVTEEGFFLSDIVGNIQFLKNALLKPAVGDWVLFEETQGTKRIVEILKRKTLIARQKEHWPFPKPITSNVDTAFLVQAFGQDMHAQRLSRMILYIKKSKVQPVVVFNKIDLATDEELRIAKQMVQDIDRGIKVVFLSTKTREGEEELKSYLRPKETFLLLGSSGVGKSSIVNMLAGEELFKTNAVTEKTGKGKHTTTFRKLVKLPGGSLLIDTPGTRNFSLSGMEEEVENNFRVILAYAQQCKFPDCSHTAEPHCAVRKAVEEGELSQEVYHDFLKLSQEAKMNVRELKKDRTSNKQKRGKVKSNQKKTRN